MIGHQAAELGNMVAVADVNLRPRRGVCRRTTSGSCQVYQDYRKLLDRKDVDVVTIGTPDHWHAKIAIDAMRAGKDVYCEKPLTLTIDEGKQICQVAKETGRVFQVGTQQRSEYGQVFLKAVAIARSGRLGEKLHALSLGRRGGPAAALSPTAIRPRTSTGTSGSARPRKVPYCPKRCDYEFRWWLEYSGGQVTDWGVHHTDIALWALGGEKTGPSRSRARATSRWARSRATMLRQKPSSPTATTSATAFDCDMKFANGNTIKLLQRPQRADHLRREGPASASTAAA